jgi:hypothetical protein
MIEQQSREDDFDSNADGGALAWQAGDKPAFEELEKRENDEDQIFVGFIQGGKKRQTDDEQQQ